MLNLFNFRQVTNYAKKKRPVVFLLFLFSLVCLYVSVQSGTNFIHSFLSAYLDNPSWFWCYAIATGLDIALFCMCSQFFSDWFTGIETEVDGETKTVAFCDPATLLIFCALLSVSLFISVKGAEVRKAFHVGEISKQDKSGEVIEKLTAGIDTAKTVVSSDIERNERKALQAKAGIQKQQNEASALLLAAVDKHQRNLENQKKDISELLDFSVTVVVIFQVLLILLTAGSENIKSKSGSKVKSAESTAKVEEVPSKSKTKSTKVGPKLKPIGFQKQEGEIVNRDGKLLIIYAKAKGGFAEYTTSNLKSQIGYYERKGKLEMVNRFKVLLESLEEAKKETA